MVNIGDSNRENSTSVPEFPGYYDKLVNSQPVQCFQTKKSFDAVQKPTAVVLDVGDIYLQDDPLAH